MTQDFASLLLEEQSNENASFLELLVKEYTSEDIVAFVEGPDDPIFYYDFLVDYYQESNIIFIPSGGKRGVLGAYANLKTYDLAVKPKKILFLCDRDFDDVLDVKTPEKIYKTDHYSIESYFFSKNYISYILRKFTGGKINTRTINAIVDDVGKEITKIHKYLLGPMSFACLMRKKKAKFDFDKISISDLIDQSRPKKNRLRAIVQKCIDGNFDYEFKSLIKISRIMRNIPFQNWIRGKIALQLIKQILNRIVHQKYPHLKNTITIISNKIGSEALIMEKYSLAIFTV